jgi:CelD/BcsL family acetyltransferase involved in cellulose biosynthesis
VYSHPHSVLATRESSEACWKKLPKKLRWEITKARRDGIEVRLDREALAGFYGIYAANLRRLGTPVMTERFFSRIAGVLADRVRFFAVRDAGRLVGGMIAVDHQRARSSLYVAIEPESMRRHAGYALYWAAIEDCCDSSTTEVFDLGRSRAGSGTHQFKRKWPGRDDLIPYMVYGEPPNAGVRGEDGFAARLWSRLPLSLCNRLGPLLRRTQPFG